MKVTAKNRAKLRRIVQPGGKAVYTGNGAKARHLFVGTVINVLGRQADHTLLIRPGGIAPKDSMVDYYRIVEHSVA